jgi:hypothetical protein
MAKMSEEELAKKMATGEINEEDLAAEAKKFAEEYNLTHNGKSCPDKHINNITPMEFEELVEMFLEYDVDGSDTIDKYEARKILLDMGMDHEMEKAEVVPSFP